MQVAHRRKKSCADNHHRDLKFRVKDHVFLGVTLMKGVMRLGKKGKLSLRFSGPFEVLEKIIPIAY